MFSSYQLGPKYKKKVAKNSSIKVRCLMEELYTDRIKLKYIFKSDYYTSEEST